MLTIKSYAYVLALGGFGYFQDQELKLPLGRMSSECALYGGDVVDS